jgi:hypothetical protein
MLYQTSLHLPYTQVKAFDSLLCHTPSTFDPADAVIFYSHAVTFSDGSDATIAIMIDTKTGTCVQCALMQAETLPIYKQVSYTQFWKDWEFVIGNNKYVLHIQPYTMLGEHVLVLSEDGWWNNIVRSVEESKIADYQVEGQRVYTASEEAARTLSNFANSAITGCCTCARYHSELARWYVDLYEGGN